MFAYDSLRNPLPIKQVPRDMMIDSTFIGQYRPTDHYVEMAHSDLFLQINLKQKTSLTI